MHLLQAAVVFAACQNRAGPRPCSPLEIDGLVYTAATGFLPSAIKSGSDLSVDNLDVEGFLDDDSVRPEDLTTGLFDDARIAIFLVNWADLDQGQIVLRKGWLGEVKRADSRFSAEIRRLANKLQQTQGILYSRLCRVDLGSPECGVDLGPLTDESMIETVTGGDGFTCWRTCAPSRRLSTICR